MATPEFTMLVACPFHQTRVDDSEWFTQFGLSELGVVVRPPSDLGIKLPCNLAQREVHPAMNLSLEYLITDTAYALTADCRRKPQLEFAIHL